jgi:predicted transcriptional regulator
MLQSIAGGNAMTITLTPETETRLREKAEREGQDINAVADALIAAALEWEAQERAEAIEGVQRGDQAAAEGRERPLSLFLDEQRAKHGLPAEWPHVSDADAR